jgi:UDP-GlcNAc:undecaprenyl-phosphate GlcNAc-1-phosphate transferase
VPSGVLHIISIGLVSFIATLALVPVTKTLAFKLDAIDYPSKRRINTYPVPRLGGLALFGGLLIAIACEAIGEAVFSWRGLFQADSLQSINYIGLMTGVAFMVLVGAIDDIKQLHAGIKFLGQIASAAIIAFSGVTLNEFANPTGAGFVEFGWISYPLTILYLVAFANIINLIDGLDGLAAGVVAIAALGLFVIAFSKGRVEAGVLSIILVGISVAFLRYNKHPASVYMGDSGALMLGTLLGVVSLVGAMRSPTFIALIVPIVLAGFPVLETIFTIARRLRRKQPVHHFDLDHFHNVLLRKGFSPQRIVLVVYTYTALLTAGGIAISNAHGVLVYALFGLLALISIFVLWRLGLYGEVLRHYYSPREKPPDSHREEE